MIEEVVFVCRDCFRELLKKPMKGHMILGIGALAQDSDKCPVCDEERDLCYQALLEIQEIIDNDGWDVELVGRLAPFKECPDHDPL